MKIFIMGAVSSADERQLEKYNLYRKVLSKFADLTTPDDIWEYRQKSEKAFPNKAKEEIDEIMVEYDLGCVRKSDLLVCDLSMQSTGVGVELGVAHEKKISAIFFYEKGAHISNMIKGAFPQSDFVEYDNLADLNDKLILLAGKLTMVQGARGKFHM